MSNQSDLPPICVQQGVGSPTWTAPPLNSGLTIPQIYAYHAKISPNHPAYAFDADDGQLRDMSYSEVWNGVRKAAKIMSDYVDTPGSLSTTDGSEVTIVGILAVTDSPTYLTVLIGIMYRGLTPFPLSVRNSAAAVIHLVRQKSIRRLLVSQDSAMQRLAQEAKEELAKEGYSVTLSPMPQFPELYDNDEGPLDVQMKILSKDDPALILHSSGSTSFPKPITITHDTFVRWMANTAYGELDVCGIRISAHCLPLFHVMGTLNIVWALGSGTIPTFFRPSSPPIIATPDTVIEAASKGKCNHLICVPTFIEAWAKNPVFLPFLKSLDVIMYAGAPLNKHVGESLIAEGVNLVTGYGSTEAGSMTLQFADPKRRPVEDYQYFRMSPIVDHVRRYQDGQPGVFELVIMDSPLWPVNVHNTEVEGRPGFDTNDLMVEHPTNPEYFRVLGRADDQIILSTGEKTNPVPMENILLQDPHITAAIMFGRGRFQNGVIIQPSEPFDPSDEAKLETFRNLIWGSVERANTFGPAHSRIFKEMITVTNPSKPFQYTAKGTPRRHVCLQDYAQEIEDVYQKVEESSQGDVEPLPEDWTADAVTGFVRRVIKRVMKAPHITDDDDLFQHGCDSLQATWIRNTLLHALRTTESRQVSIHDVPLNFVYANPSIAALSKFFLRLLSGGSVDQEVERAARLGQMKELLEEYGTTFPSPRWRTSDASGPALEAVLITGTTGRLGSHLLAKLLQDSKVSRVYALNRGASQNSVGLANKQAEAFDTWGLDSNLLSTKVSFHAADLAKPNFELSEEVFHELRDSVTTIMHNAWRVDFNVSLPSFKPLIAGARNLIDFALHSSIPNGPRLLFVSSISSLHNYQASTPVLETLDFGPELAVGLGYGESKWVTEQILGRAQGQTGLRTTSVRVGQLSGDSRAGGWNTKEWVPAIVRASRRLGCVPNKVDTISWVPVDTAASALLEMRHIDERVLHLTAPRPVSWRNIFEPVSEVLQVPLVPAEQWLEKLRKSAREAEEVSATAGDHDSAHTLLDFFEAALSGKEVLFDTANAVNVSPSLAEMRFLGKEDVSRWLSFWTSVGYLG